MIYTSPFGSLPIPQDKTLWDFLELHAHNANAHAPAFVCSVSARQVSFSQMLTQARQICAGLHASGVKKGDVVVLHSINCIEYPVVLYALNRLEVICSPASSMFNAQELSGQAFAAKAKAIITHKSLARVATDAANLCGIHPSHVYTMAPGPEDVNLVSIEEFIWRNLTLPDLPPIDPEAVVLLPFSSGTTGRPKGVKMSARALLAATISFSFIDQPGQYSLALLPFYHIMATTLSNSCIYRGKTVVVMPRFVPEQFLSLVEQFQLEKLHMAPPVVLFLAQHPMVANYDLSRLKEISCGGAPLGIEIESLVEIKLNATVLQGFGMSELCGGAVYSTPYAKRLGSTGKLMPNASLKVKCLRTGKNLPPNQLGELMFHTPHIMAGYLNNPEATKAAFDEDGFVRSGDIGYIDDDGFVFIVDRIKELIKYKGHQVAPAELEDVLNNHPSVTDSCCVRGYNFTTSEEIPKAYVVLKHALEPDTVANILAFVASKVAPFKIVREVEFIDAIPRTMSGKILRRELQAKENEKLNAIRRQHVSIQL